MALALFQIYHTLAQIHTIFWLTLKIHFQYKYILFYQISFLFYIVKIEAG